MTISGKYGISNTIGVCSFVSDISSILNTILWKCVKLTKACPYNAILPYSYVVGEYELISMKLLLSENEIVLSHVPDDLVNVPLTFIAVCLVHVNIHDIVQLHATILVNITFRVCHVP